MVRREVSGRKDRLIETTLNGRVTLQILSANGCAGPIGTGTSRVAIQILDVVASFVQHRLEGQVGVQISSVFVEDAHVGPFHNELTVRGRSHRLRSYGAVGMHDQVIPERRNLRWRNGTDAAAGASDGFGR